MTESSEKRSQSSLCPGKILTFPPFISNTLSFIRTRSLGDLGKKIPIIPIPLGHQSPEEHRAAGPPSFLTVQSPCRSAHHQLCLPPSSVGSTSTLPSGINSSANPLSSTSLKYPSLLPLMPSPSPCSLSNCGSFLLHQSGLVVGEATSLLLPESCLSSSKMYSFKIHTLRLFYPLLTSAVTTNLRRSLRAPGLLSLIPTLPLSYTCMVSIHCRWLFQISWLLKSLNFSPPKISSSSLSHIATHFCGHSQDFAQWLHYLSSCKNVWTKLFRQRCSEKESFWGSQPFLITENMSFMFQAFPCWEFCLQLFLLSGSHLCAFKSRICHMDFHSV